MEVKTFPQGGAHIPEYKEYTHEKPVARLPVPDEVIIPLNQHLGETCKPLVKVGEKVIVGQKIGDLDEYWSAPVHSSVNGTVKAIEPRLHPQGDMVESIVIACNKGQQDFKAEVKRDYKKMSTDDMKEAIREAGVVGMGGAAVPIYININQRQAIDALLLNGAECEPFLTNDHRQMVEKAKEMVAGAEILMKIIGATKCFIGIEVNKPDAIKTVEEKIKGKKGFQVVPLAVKYPQGYKQHLITAITGRRVPRGARSSEIGCIVRNVGSTIACYEAVVYGKPLYERVVTVSGPDVPNRGNYMVPVGTTAGHIIKACGVEDLTGSKVVLGGPMTGNAIPRLDVPVIKSTTGVLVLPPSMISAERTYTDCVHCGRCVDHCPMLLYPNKISIYAEHGVYDKAEEWNITDCMECGICTYMCPAKRPIVHFIKKAAPVVKKMQRSRRK